jgi:cation/acetate symporter
MVVGTVSTLVLIYLSPTIQIDLMHGDSAIFPLKNPALVTIPLSFISGAVVSMLRPEADAERRFSELESLTHLG